MIAVALVGGLAAAGTVGAVGNVIGGETAAKGAEKAAQTQATAETQAVNEQTTAQQQAIQAEQQQGNQAAALQQPYEGYGTTAGNILSSELASGQLGGPAPLDQASIEQMPGYQFTLQQGLLSTQNAAAAQGLGVSGTALGAASAYATGLANENFQNYFSDYWANQNNRYNMLYNTTQLGANAATNAGNQMISVGGQVGNTLTTSAGNIANTETTSAANIGSAQATAAADQGQGIASGASSLGTGISNALLANALLGQTQGGSTIAGGGQMSVGTQNAINALSG